MKPSPSFQSSDWTDIKLIVFDVDGTLYDQRRLRIYMAYELLLHVARTQDVRAISVISTYRRVRDRLAQEGTGDFEIKLIAETSTVERCSVETVRSIVGEWIERRPLRYLLRCRYARVLDLFLALKRRDKIIGVLSDYPAQAKLTALGLSADHVVSAGDSGIGFLKPHPRGLESLLAAAGVEAEAAALIGDRKESDGIAAKLAGVRVLLRSSRRIEGYQTFTGYDAPLFAPLFAS